MHFIPKTDLRLAYRRGTIFVQDDVSRSYHVAVLVYSSGGIYRYPATSWAALHHIGDMNVIIAIPFLWSLLFLERTSALCSLCYCFQKGTLRERWSPVSKMKRCQYPSRGLRSHDSQPPHHRPCTTTRYLSISPSQKQQSRIRKHNSSNDKPR